MVEKLPEVNPPSGRVPGRGLLVTPILESRRLRNIKEFVKKGSVLEGFVKRCKYRTKGGQGVAPGVQEATWRSPPLGRARRAPRRWGHPLVPPFGPYIPLITETLEILFFSRSSPLFRRHGDSKIGTARRTCPGTLPEGGLTSGSFSTSMSASRISHE